MQAWERRNRMARFLWAGRCRWAAGYLCAVLLALIAIGRTHGRDCLATILYGPLSRYAVVEHDFQSGLSVVTDRGDSLRFLARAQRPDGRWDGGAAAGPRGALGATSWVLLSYSYHGNSNKFGRFRRQVAAGQAWLLRQQRADGSFGPWTLENSLATQALCEAYGMSQDYALEKPAARAVRSVLATQNRDGGWGAGPDDTPSRPLHTVHALMALVSAKAAGLESPPVQGAVAGRSTPGREQGQAGKPAPQTLGASWAGLKAYYGEVVQLRADGTAVALDRPGGTPSLEATVYALSAVQFLGWGRDDPRVQGLLRTLMERRSVGARGDALPWPTEARHGHPHLWFFATSGFWKCSCFHGGKPMVRWGRPILRRIQEDTLQADTFVRPRIGSCLVDRIAKASPAHAWGVAGGTALYTTQQSFWYRYTNCLVHGP